MRIVKGPFSWVLDDGLYSTLRGGVTFLVLSYGHETGRSSLIYRKILIEGRVMTLIEPYEGFFECTEMLARIH